MSSPQEGQHSITRPSLASSSHNDRKPLRKRQSVGAADTQVRAEPRRLSNGAGVSKRRRLGKTTKAQSFEVDYQERAVQRNASVQQRQATGQQHRAFAQEQCQSLITGSGELRQHSMDAYLGPAIGDSFSQMANNTMLDAFLVQPLPLMGEFSIPQNGQSTALPTTAVTTSIEQVNSFINVPHMSMPAEIESGSFAMTTANTEPRTSYGAMFAPGTLMADPDHSFVAADIEQPDLPSQETLWWNTDVDFPMEDMTVAPPQFDQDAIDFFTRLETKELSLK